jgi:hypothetical protein
MAKISANGAAEVCRVEVLTLADYRYTLVMCSDGRILRRPADATESYTLYIRGIRPEKRTIEGLRQFCRYAKMTVTHEGRGSSLKPVVPPPHGDDFASITRETFAAGELFSLNIQRYPGHTVSVSCLDRDKLRHIARVIESFLEEDGS